MLTDVAAALHELTERSLAAQITFPDVVRTLTTLGAESYLVDLYRAEETVYLTSGESHRFALDLPPVEIAHDFSAAGVEAAVRASQRGELPYREFVGRIAEAGATSYIVYLTGRFVAYIGRDGSQHIERFPAAL